MRRLWERNIELEKVIRYGTRDEWKPMFYRPNLRIHTQRVFWMTREITSFLSTINNNIFSKDITDELALFHDDVEIMTWDIISLEKEAFSEQEKIEYEKSTLSAIDFLAKSYKDLSKYNYKKLLLLDVERKSIEYLIVSYADKLDAHMEICHEIFAGNSLCISSLSRFWNNTFPYDYTRNKILKIQKQLSDIFKTPLHDSLLLFMTSQILDFRKVCALWLPHTSETIKENTWYILYDTWKNLHFQHGELWEREYLYKQRES